MKIKKTFKLNLFQSVQLELQELQALQADNINYEYDKNSLHKIHHNFCISMDETTKNIHHFRSHS